MQDTAGWPRPMVNCIHSAGGGAAQDVSAACWVQTGLLGPDKVEHLFHT